MRGVVDPLRPPFFAAYTTAAATTTVIIIAVNATKVNDFPQ